MRCKGCGKEVTDLEICQYCCGPAAEKPFNGLTPAEAERLALLAEEAGEMIQAIGKVLRHGYDRYNTLLPSTSPSNVSNRVSLERECADVLHAMKRLCEARDLDEETIHEREKIKALTVRKYLHHND